MMFRSPAAPDPLPLKVVEVPAADLIPLSHLSLDLDVPPIGWLTYLGNIGVEVLTDDIGRSAIHRHDARRLFDEHRENEVRKAELRAAAEKRAVEADLQLRAQMPAGVKVPDGMTYAEAAMQAELDALSYQRRRRSPLEDALDGAGMTFHSLAEHDVKEAS
jgi:hypothetical protein